MPIKKWTKIIPMVIRILKGIPYPLPSGKFNLKLLWDSSTPHSEQQLSTSLTTNEDKDVEKKEFLFTVCGDANNSPCGNQFWDLFKMLQTELTYDTNISLLHIWPEYSISSVGIFICIFMSSAALFTVP